MTLYITPKITDRSAELATLAAKAGVRILEPAHLYEMYPDAIGGGMVFATLDDDQLALLHRYMGQLLPEVPTAVMSAPGVVYSAQWMMLASPLPVVDYIEISGKIAKSGLLAHKPDDVHRRGPVGRPTEVGSIVRPTFQDDEPEVDEDPADAV